MIYYNVNNIKKQDHCKIIYILITIILLLSSHLVYSTPVDLTEKDIYVRKGFSTEWISKLPEKDNASWKRIEGSKGNRPVRITEIDFKNTPKFSFIKPGHQTIENFTLISEFNLTERQLNSHPLSIYLAQIGLNWEIYINGKLLKSEIHLSKNKDKILIERAVRGEIIDINYPFLKIGSNIIAFRIIGDPTDDRTGLYRGKPYLIDNGQNFRDKYTERIVLMLLAIYFSFGIFHIFLFVARNNEYFYLNHGIASILIFIFLFCRTTVIFSVIENTLLLKYIELVSLFFLMPFSVFFIDQILRGKRTLFSKYYFFFCLSLSFLLFYNKTTALRLWQYSSFIPIIHMSIYNVFTFFIKEFISFFNHHRENNLKKIFSFFKAIISSFIHTIPGNLLIGIIVTAFAAALDIIGATTGETVNYTIFGIFYLFFGTVIILANRFNQVFKSLENLNISLEEKIIERTKELSAANYELEEMNDSLAKARDALWSEMSIAKKIQTVLLPKKPILKGYEISVYMEPADEVGGDYYDIINIGGKDWVVIGDVSGHGVPAGLVMIMAQSSIHTAVNQNPNLSPSKLLSIINKTLTNNIKHFEDFKYMTITIFESLNNGKFKFSGLHQDIMVFRKESKTVELIETDGSWIGLMDNIDSMVYDSSLKLNPGDTMLLYTDGITESWKSGTKKEKRTIRNDMFGEEKLKIIFESLGEKSTEDIKMGILKELQKDYTCVDDVTMVVLRYLGE